MRLTYRTVVISFGFLEIWTVSAQDGIRRAIRDDRKSMILESVKPSQYINDPKGSSIKVTLENTPDLNIKLSRKDGGAFFDDKYMVDSKLMNLSDKDFFKINPGQEIKAVMIDGKIRLIPVKDSDRILDHLSQRDQLEGVMLRQEIGGLNLSGWKKKKTSEKAKKLLKDEFGIVVED